MARRRGAREQPGRTPPAPAGARIDRVAALQQVTAALSSALTMEDVARVLFDTAMGRCGARAIGIVWSFVPGTLRLAFGRGVSEEEFQAIDEAAHRGARTPVHDALRTRAPVWVSSPEEIRARYPVLEGLRERRGEHGFAFVPLVVGERCPGFVGITFGREHVPTPADRRFVEALAQLGAQAFDRARLFEAEQEARREAEQVGRIQEQLMAVVGHDLRTPLSAVSLAAHSLTRRGDLPPDVRAAVDRIASSAARMGAIIRDLLDVTRSRQGVGMSIREARVDLGEVARRALAELDGAHGEGRVSLAVSGAPTLVADPDRLAQVASNLVGNAIQHGSGSHVAVEVSGGEHEVTLAVSNGGPPIAPELLPHVFEPFRRGRGAGHALDRASPSTGLGLFIVREIVQAHGGAVTVRSDAATGTVFAVTLPRSRARETEHA